MSGDFLNSRNKRRRVYNYERAPKDTFDVVIGDVTRSFDKNSIVIHRDFYLIRDRNGDISSSIPIIPVVYAEYDEDYILFNGESLKSRAFNITFSSLPFVTLMVEPTNSLENIVPYIETISTTNLTVGLSSYHSGNVRYRAIYSSTWPALAQRNVLFPALYYTASAGFVSVPNSDIFTASYVSVGSVPSTVFLTTFDFNNLDDVDVAFVQTSSYSLTDVSGNLSSFMNNRINYMAVV